MIEIYTKDGKQTFKNGVSYDEYEKTLKKAYRKDGPSYIDYYDNGNIKAKKWYLNGNLYRKDGPSIIEYYENGNIKHEEYNINGKITREDGPAIITYNKHKNITSKEYWLNNKLYSFKVWKKKLNIQESNVFESFKESYNKLK